MEVLNAGRFGEEIAALVEGAQTFRKTEYCGDRNCMPRLAAGQHPDVMMIGCSDSRVDPGLICAARPGDVFLVRNVANLVPAYNTGHGRGDSVRAALEYGVKALGVSHIVVFGHSGCGGIKAMIDTVRGIPSEFEFVAPWMRIADTVCDRVLAELASDEGRDTTADELQAHTVRVERRSVVNSIDNLRSYPWIRDRSEAHALTLHGWWFDLEDGRLWAADPETGAFLPVEAA